LDLLAQRLKSTPKNRTIAGLVTLNGKALGKTVKLRHYSCYVQQENSLIGVLTVGETMRFTARLTGASQDRIRPILKELGLLRNEHTKVGNIFIKGLSGGEKRRLR
jgi:ABC-type multidrug transport system ATPase subunit